MRWSSLQQRVTVLDYRLSHPLSGSRSYHGNNQLAWRHRCQASLGCFPEGSALSLPHNFRQFLLLPPWRLPTQEGKWHQSEKRLLDLWPHLARSSVGRLMSATQMFAALTPFCDVDIATECIAFPAVQSHAGDLGLGATLSGDDTEYNLHAKLAARPNAACSFSFMRAALKRLIGLTFVWAISGLRQISSRPKVCMCSQELR